MTTMSVLHDHYTVISRSGRIHASRIVIADSCTDAAQTHREHYPGYDIIGVFHDQRLA